MNSAAFKETVDAAPTNAPLAEVPGARTLYSVTGDIKDINTLLISRSAYRALEPMWCGCGDGIVADSGAKCGTCAYTDLLHCEADAERYRWLRQRFIAADFDWNESGTQVLIFTYPGTPLCADCDQTIDVAIAHGLNGSPARQGARPSDPDLNPISAVKDLSVSASPATKEQQ